MAVDIVVTERVRFAAGAPVADGGSEAVLADLAHRLATVPQIMQVVVIGHATPTGDPDADFRLSLARAIGVWQDLVSRGVQPDRVSLAARGGVDGLGDVVEFDVIDAAEGASLYRHGSTERHGVSPWTGDALPWTSPVVYTSAPCHGHDELPSEPGDR